MTEHRARPRDDRVHRAVVHNYLAAVRFVWTAGEQSTDPQQQEFLRIAAAHLRNARVFELDPQAYITLDTTVDQYCTEIIGGEKWQPAEAGEPAWRSPGGQEGYMARLREAAAAIPYPQHWPFEVCYFAIGGTGVGCGVSRWADICMRKGQVPSPYSERAPASLLAIVATTTGEVFELLAGPENEGIALYVRGRREAQQEGWPLSTTLLGYPWLLPALLNAINANDTVIERDLNHRLADRLAAQKLAKTIRRSVLPPLYYRVTIQPQRLTEHPTAPPRPRNWHFRWDVRGHFFTRVQRGTLPLDPKLYRRLLKARYQVFHALNPLTSEAAVVLMRRRLAPPGPEEWVAVLRGWREAFVKGPKELPYIPSTHRPRRMLPVAARLPEEEGAA